MNSDHSLLNSGQPEQLDLISSADMPDEVFARDEARGQFTGERLFRQDPEKYRWIVSLLAEGVPQRRIAALCRVHPATVRAIREREPGAIDTEKERLSRGCRMAAQMLTDSILEDMGNNSKMGKTSIRDKAVTLGVLVDKSQLLSGAATSRVESLSVTASHDDFNAYLQELRAKSTGLGGGSESKRAEGADSGAGERGAGVAAIDGGRTAEGLAGKVGAPGGAEGVTVEGECEEVEDAD